MTNASPSTQPVTHARIIKGILKSATDSKPSVRLRMNNAGTENMIPDDAPLTADAIVWLMLFSTMLLRRITPRSTPQPRMAANSEPSIANPRMSAA